MKLAPAKDIKVGDVLIFVHCFSPTDDWNHQEVVIIEVPDRNNIWFRGHLKTNKEKIGSFYPNELFVKVESNQKRDKNGRFLGKARNKPLFTPLYKRGDIVEQTDAYEGRLFLIENHKADNVYDTICLKKSGWNDGMKIGSKNSSILKKEWSRLFINGDLLKLPEEK